MISPGTSPRNALFGGTLMIAGLVAPQAVGQQLLPDPAYAGFGQLNVYAYFCEQFEPDGACGVFASSGTNLFDANTGTTDSISVGDSVYSVESSPKRFALTRTELAPGVAADFLFVDRAYTYAYFIVSGEALAQYEFDYGIPGAFGQGTLTLGSLVVNDSGSGQVVLQSGDPIRVQGRAGAPTMTFRVSLSSPGCSPADIAEPFGVLCLGDINAFIIAFLANDSVADLAAPMGIIDLRDVDEFISGYLAGCP